MSDFIVFWQSGGNFQRNILLDTSDEREKNGENITRRYRDPVDYDDYGILCNNVYQIFVIVWSFGKESLGTYRDTPFCINPHCDVPAEATDLKWSQTNPE